MLGPRRCRGRPYPVLFCVVFFGLGRGGGLVVGCVCMDVYVCDNRPDTTHTRTHPNPNQQNNHTTPLPPTSSSSARRVSAPASRAPNAAHRLACCCCWPPLPPSTTLRYPSGYGPGKGRGACFGSATAPAPSPSLEVEEVEEMPLISRSSLRRSLGRRA